MKKRRTQLGFTLIELLVTVAIVAILAAIAYPSYLNQVRKSRRSEARAAVLEAANREERFYTTQYKYTTTVGKGGLGMNELTEGKWYKLSILPMGELGGASAENEFLVIAEAQNDQTNDDCRYIAVNQLGEKLAATAGLGDISDECW